MAKYIYILMSIFMFFQLNFGFHLGNASATVLTHIPDGQLTSLTFVLEYPEMCFPEG
jgi:hypothetical protein